MREMMLILHLTGLTMVVGTSFAILFLGNAASKMDDDEADKFMLHASRLGTMGHIGLGILILSGGYLMTPYWAILPTNPLLMAKLSLVVVLAIFMGMAAAASKKARKGDLSRLKRSLQLGAPILFTSLLIVTLAVLVFR